jgi:hypothetical protein
VRRIVRQSLFVLAALSAAPSAARAQVLPADPVTNGRAQVGPVQLTPRIELRDVGIDTNVFNEEVSPKRDFTMTVRPGVDAGFRFGPGRFLYRSWMDFVYFQKYTEERAVNRFGDLRAELRMTRVVPYVSIGGLDTTDRPNNEIDLRAKRVTQTFGAGAAVQLFSRTAAIVGYQKQSLEYDPNQVFQGEDLATQLNSDRTTFETGLRMALTPITTMILTVAKEDVRFDVSKNRDSDSIRFGPRFEFAPDGPLSGYAAVGFRRFTPITSDLKPYRGLIAQVGTRLTLGSGTRIDVQYARDVEYSIEEALPYYITNNGRLTVTQILNGPYDVQGYIGRERASYQALESLAVEPSAPDTTNLYAFGGGYRFKENARLGLNLEFTHRETHRTGKSYDRRRLLGTLTYGF